MKDWISVKDRLPKDKTYVLVYYNGGNWGDPDGDPNFKIAKFEMGRGPCVNNERDYLWKTFGALQLWGQDVDFWMPLPVAPTWGGVVR